MEKRLIDFIPLDLKRNLRTLVVGTTILTFGGQTAIGAGLDAQDMAFAFGDTPTLNASSDFALLSEQEMLDTEGQALPIAAAVAIGARLAVSGYKAHKAKKKLKKAFLRATRNGKGRFHDKHGNFRLEINRNENTGGFDLTYNNVEGQRRSGVGYHKFEVKKPNKLFKALRKIGVFKSDKITSPHIHAGNTGKEAGLHRPYEGGIFLKPKPTPPNPPKAKGPPLSPSNPPAIFKPPATGGTGPFGAGGFNR